MKAKQLRELSKGELNKKCMDLRRELMQARFAHVKQELKNPLKIRFLRREIARILTIIGEEK
jgi:large subunit ribosomal protein L29